MFISGVEHYIVKKNCTCFGNWSNNSCPFHGGFIKTRGQEIPNLIHNLPFRIRYFLKGVMKTKAHKNKKRPTAFIAVCQCGNTIGALDFNRTTRKDAGIIMGGWLYDGCTVVPKFDSSSMVELKPCQCDSKGRR